MPDENTNTESLRRTRIRAVIERRFVGILLGLLVLGILAGGVAYQVHLDPAVETNEETVSTWGEETTLSHQAQVHRPNLVFEEDRTLTDRQVYFAHLSPELEGVQEYTYNGSGDSELDVTSSASLQLSSVGREDEVYWERTDQLDEQQTQLSPGETARTAVEINVTEAVQEIERIQSSLDSTIGRAEIGVVFVTRVTGTVNGKSVANVHRNSLVVEPSDTTYSVESTSGSQKVHERIRTVESEVTYGPLASYAPFGLMGGSFVAILGLVSLRYLGRLGPSPAAMVALERQQQREEFADWISTGDVPEAALHGTGVELRSLEDIVDVAIDTKQRVLEDTDRETFYVLAGDWYYVYHPTESEQTILDPLDVPSQSSRPSDNGGTDEEDQDESTGPVLDRDWIDRVSKESDSDGSRASVDGDGHVEGQPK